MRVFRIRGGIDPEPIGKMKDAIAFRCDAARSLEEIELAYHLAKRSLERKNSIARDLKYEFLLWLAGKRDIQSAIKNTAPEKGEGFLVAVFSDPELAAVCRLLDAEPLPTGLKKRGEPLGLERISLSRVKA